jgi:hypothetical protein
MYIKSKFLVLLLVCQVTAVGASDYLNSTYGGLLPQTNEKVGLWWASSGWKISPDKSLPETVSPAIIIRAARNEAEAAQLVIRPQAPLSGFVARPGNLTGPASAVIPVENIDILRVRYVNVTTPTDKSAVTGFWPDPLPPFNEPIKLEANKNQPIWVRVRIPHNIPAGVYTGRIQLKSRDYRAEVPLRVEVYDFNLPEKMTCTTAFGFSASSVFHYHKLKDDEQKRQVLDKYWASFSAHHISPYNPAPLDSIKVTWPAIKPLPSKWDNWENLRLVSNESYSGNGAMLIYDDNPENNVTVSYRPLITIPKEGLHIRFWYRTAIPDHRFLVTLNHYNKEGQWISGHNNDMSIKGSGEWQKFDEVITDFPSDAHSVRLMARATRWTETGEDIGLVWFDDISVTHPQTKQELVTGGDFESSPRTELLLPAEKLKPKLNFTDWDKAMTRALDYYHFNSFRLGIPGIGGGTYHAISPPQLLGLGEDTPEYPLMFDSYCRQMQAHLTEKGWLDEAFVYWFDEPSPDQYAFVKNGFDKLKKASPGINRMLTEQPEPPLYGGPNIYCVVSYLYKHEIAEQRRAQGDKFWWYICTGPKAPYCTLFIDHPGTELRVWLWQSWQRNIEGILIWQSNYWTSDAAYPDPDQPQNPYEDPMGWVSGYSTPKGTKKTWGNGDGRFIYPPEAAADAHPTEPVLDGPVDSIRWEMLRDGIEDYEYLAILKRLLESKKAMLSPERYNEFSWLLEVPENITKDMTHFTIDPEPIEKRRRMVAEAIEKLSKI